ncbi:MAG: manganese efflux pump MntP family protein [Acidobacteriota bacterium]|jgi:putative Mn2+ efflux pump MntP|nr:manganese efflux pump MntP family protein [Acidobacteriota bacterium]
MDWLNLLAMAVALAMDALAVALVTGLTLHPLTGRRLFRMSFHFGLFQALMPMLGWAAGRAVYGYISAFDHWMAFALLGFVGGRMFWGALRGGMDGDAPRVDPTSGWELVALSVATSIDALAVGLSLAALGSGILAPAAVIGLVAAAFTLAGMLLGRRIGAHWGRRVEAAGGLILVAIGVRILVQHLME